MGVGQLTERFVGGVLAPIIIMMVSVVASAHAHGYLPVWMTPILLVIVLVGTDTFRRPTAHGR